MGSRGGSRGMEGDFQEDTQDTLKNQGEEFLCLKLRWLWNQFIAMFGLYIWKTKVGPLQKRFRDWFPYYFQEVQED